MIVELERLRAISRYAEQMLRLGRIAYGTDAAYIEREQVASELLELLTLQVDYAASPEREAMAELALWSRRSAESVTSDRLGELLLFELVSVWLDNGKPFDEFVSTLRRVWDGTLNARGALDRLARGRSKG